MTGNRFDMLVIGEGLAGITAAAASAGQGMRVILASKGPGTFVMGTACADLQGLQAVDVGVADLNPEKMEEAIGFFVELTASAGCAYNGSLGERRLVPTVTGNFQEVSLAPSSLWKGDPRGLKQVVVSGIETLAGFNASFVAERLSFHSKQMGLDTLYRSVAVKLPSDHGRALTTVEVASRIDREPAYRRAFIDGLHPVIGDAELLILPGVLGMKSGDEDIRHFEADIGCAVCELATLPPSVPGLRLLQRLERRLVHYGVELCTGFAVQKLCWDGDQCTGAVLDTPGRPRRIHADSVVLAGGKFSNLLPEHAPNTNLFACGSLLGRREARHGNAIAIITGYQAAMLACQRGVHYAAR